MGRLTSVEVKLVVPAAPITAPVLSTELCTRGKSSSFVRHIVLDVSGTPIERRFHAGQALGVVPPGRDASGNPFAPRLFAIASPKWGEDGQARHVALLVKRVIDEHHPIRPSEDPLDHHLHLGVCSNFLCDRVPGDAVQLTGPRGRRFVLPERRSDHDYLFVATGTGIAPFRAFVLELLADESYDGRIVLVAGAPYTTDLLYDELFDRLAVEDPRFSYVRAVSRESRRRYVHTAVADALDVLRPMLIDRQTLVYLCGVRDMHHGLFKLLRAEGLDRGYLEMDEVYRTAPVERWPDDGINRHVHAGPRLRMQVY